MVYGIFQQIQYFAVFLLEGFNSRQVHLKSTVFTVLFLLPVIDFVKTEW